MLTVEQFHELEVGDLIEVAPIFSALTADPVTLHTDKKDLTKDRLEFVVTYLGITLGRWSCTIKDGELTWTTW